MNNKLFVGNLSFNTTENDLQDAFAAHGTVLEANKDAKDLLDILRAGAPKQIP